jgi:urease accessory protein
LRLTRDELACAFCRTVESGATDGNLAIVEGTVARALDLTAAAAILVELRGVAAGMLSAAVRLGRLSSIRAQLMLHALAPAILAAQAEALGRAPNELRATAPELDISALEHARADARLFAT